ncbi:MAG: hypothetical protein NT145_05475 [Elusimicrobia bacterium]|nr:hypothetical protein [Elusimicrobiota bacterium]
MTIFVKVITRLTLGLIFLLGFYIFVFARKSHGVGFASGLIISLGLLLFMLAYGKEMVLKKVNYVRLALIKDLFLFIFCFLTFVIIFFGSNLPNLKNFKLISIIVSVFSNMSLALVSAGCFFLMFLNLLTFKKRGDSD